MPEVNGAEELRRRLEVLGGALPAEAGKALYQFAVSVVEPLSVERTPVQFGVLRGSHETLKPEVSGNDVSVAIVVGGPSVGYAVPVHEILTAHHHVGQAKFLESAVHDTAPRLAEEVAQRVKLNRLT